MKIAPALLLAAFVLAACKRQEPFEILEAPPQPGLQKYWQVPSFTLTERSGQPLTRADLAGNVWVADFFYTTCPGPCPMMTSRLVALQERLGTKDDVRLVSISLDPAKDTPEVLRQYAERFKAGANWLFCTGDKTAIYELVSKGFKLSAVEERNNPEPIIHSTKLVLVDRAGWVRGFYEGVGEDQNAKLAADIDRLRTEQP
ncbi:MAG: SCO family protein [Chthoniobacteraceae bacterium]